ncbi:MAG: hypothetical protein PHF15_15585 [Rhodoferax sp.]|nr:hypothetical protein [Rhodoferax sp.]MDD2920381.1 hypothetical protein [Rhodoferax sp.]
MRLITGAGEFDSGVNRATGHTGLGAFPFNLAEVTPCPLFHCRRIVIWQHGMDQSAITVIVTGALRHHKKHADLCAALLRIGDCPLGGLASKVRVVCGGEYFFQQGISLVTWQLLRFGGGQFLGLPVLAMSLPTNELLLPAFTAETLSMEVSIP